MDKNENVKNVLIWAKFSRYPWWPAFLTGEKAEELLEVQFFGTFEYSMLKENCIRPFNATPNFDPKDARNKGLQLAIRSACRVRDGRSTVSEEIEAALRADQQDGSSPKKRKFAKLSDESVVTDSNLSDILLVNTSPMGELLSENPSDFSKPPVQRSQVSKEEPFEALYKQLKLYFDKLADLDSQFGDNFEVFCSFLRACLDDCYAKQLVSSDVGRLVIQLKQHIFSSDLPKEQRRECLYTISGLLASMKKKILNYFFAKSLDESDLPGHMSANIENKIMEIAFSPKNAEKSSLGYHGPSQHTTSHRTVKKICEEAEVDELKEKFKLSADIRNRILKKLSKILLHNSGQKLTKVDSEKLAKGVHEIICSRASSLMDYKRAIVQVVQQKSEIRKFFAFCISTDPARLSELFCEQIVPSILT